MSHICRNFLKASCFAGVPALLIVAWQGLFLYEELKPIYFRITVQSSISDKAALYYDDGQGFGEQKAIYQNILGDGQFHVISFKLPRKTIYRLRFDPLRKPGMVAIREASIVNSTGKMIRQIELSRLQPLYEIGIFRVSREAIEFQIPANAQDPQINVVLTAPLNFTSWNSYPVFDLATQLIIKFTGLFLVFFFLAYLCCCFKKPEERRLFIFLIVLVLWRAWMLYEAGWVAYLQITMHSPAPGLAAVYYDTGSGLSEKESFWVDIQKGHMDKDYRFLLPKASIKFLRFDPLTGPGMVSVSKIAIVDGYGNLLQRLDPLSLKPAQQIAEFSIKNGRVIMVMADQANDPQVNILLPSPIELGQTRPFPFGAFRNNLLKNIAGIGLIGILLFWGYRRYPGIVARTMKKVERAVSKLSLWHRIAAASICLAAASLSGIVLMRFWDVGIVAYLIANVILVWSASLSAILFICAHALSGKRADALATNLLVLSISIFVMIPTSEFAVRLIFRNISTTPYNDSYFSRQWFKTHGRLNSYGYREKEFDNQKAPGTFRVLVIGDSLTFGQGIEEDERFTNRLDRELKSSGFEFLNFGRCGAETVDELETLKSIGLELKPDFVLLQWYINDVEGRDKSGQPKTEPLLNHWIGNFLRQNSALYYIIEQMWKKFHDAWSQGKSYPEYMRRRFSDPKGPEFQKYRTTLQEFIHICKGSDIKVGLVLFPHIGPGMESRYDYDFLHREVRQICREEGVPYLDLFDTFAAYSERYKEFWANRFDPHPSSKANEMAAGKLLETFGPTWRCLYAKTLSKD